MPTATWPMPDQESSQERSPWSARSYEGIAHPANPSAARRSWPRWLSTLLDYLIRPLKKRLRDCQPERFGSFEVDDQLEFRGLLDRKFLWPAAL
jgi:hypothetical protein